MDVEKKKKENSTTRKLGVGLDCGTMTLIASFANDQQITYRAQRDAFFDVENNHMSKTMLDKLNANYIESEDKRDLFIIGNEALQLANFFNKEIRRPLAKGVISTKEKEALGMIKVILKALVGNPLKEGEILHYSVPAEPIDSDFNVAYHDNVLNTFLASFGYKPVAMNESLAVGWAELGDENFSGLSISFGAGMCNFALMFMGISETNHQWSVCRGGDFIDTNAATALGLKASRITTIKESGIDLKNPKGREQEAIRIYYENLIKYACNAIEKKANSSNDLPNFPEPITVVVSGGTSKAGNFEVLFEEELKTKRLPFQIKQIKKASDQLNSVAKGCLLNSLNHYAE